MPNIISKAILISLPLLLICCGEDSNQDSSNNANNTNNALPATFECGDTTCERPSQYCATIVTDAVRHVCLSKATDCKSCDCVDLETNLTAQTGSQDCTATASTDVTFTCAYYDDIDAIKTSCTARGR